MPEAPTAGRSDPVPDHAVTGRALAWRYTLLMASVGLVSLGFTAAYLAVGGRIAVPAGVLLANLLALALLNGLAGWALFAPVRRALDGATSVRAAYRRLNRLPAASALWVFFIGFLYTGWELASGRYPTDPARMDALSAGYKAATLTWYALVYAAYFALYAAFAASACARRARACLSLRSPPEEADIPGRLPLRLGLVLAMLTLLPPLVIVLDLTVFSAMRDAQGLSTERVIFLDLLATLTVGGLAAVFATRLIAGPLDVLESAVARVARGDYERVSPVSGNDEFGRLTLHFNRLTLGLREREVIRREFGRYLGPAIARRILDASDQDGDLRQASELREATILFSDLEGFTPLTARVAPTELIALLDQYFRLIDEVVRSHGGIIQSFIGDAVHASFNFVDDCPDHAAAALGAAVEIQRRLATTRFPGGETMRTRIGVHTGAVTAGAIGSAERMNFAMFGNAVNVAMRLEQLNKERGTRVLASRETVQACSAARRAGLQLRDLGEVALRGCSAPVGVFQVGAAEPHAQPT